MLESSAGVCPVKRPFAEQLFAWGRRLAGAGGGSLAYRFALGFVCTARGAAWDGLGDPDLLLIETSVPGGEGWVAKGGGPAPATWWIHATTYSDRGSAVFSFLLEAPALVAPARRGGTPVVTGTAHGPSEATLRSLETALGRGNLVALDGVGVLSFGSTADDAGEPLLALAGGR